MNKKVRLTSACVAALLAVAPVITPVATGVVNADEVGQGADQNKNVANTEKTNISVKATKIAAGKPNFTPVATGQDVTLKNLPEGFTVNRFEDVANIYRTKADADQAVKDEQANAKKTVKDVDLLKAGTTYYEVANLILNVPDANAEYKVNNGVNTLKYRSDANSTIKVPVIYEITAQDMSDNTDKKANSDSTDTNKNTSDSNSKDTNSGDNTDANKNSNGSENTNNNDSKSDNHSDDKHNSSTENKDDSNKDTNKSNNKSDTNESSKDTNKSNNKSNTNESSNKSDEHHYDTTYGQPFFVDAQNTPYANGQTINAPSTLKDPSDPTGNAVLAPTNVKNIAEMLNSMKLRAYLSSATDENALQEVTESDVTNQLKNIGVTPDKQGNVTLPAGGFTYVMRVTNPGTKNSATLNIFFKAPDADYSAYPLIKFGKVNVMQGGNNFNEAPVAIVKLNDKDWRANVLKQFSATQSSVNNTSIELKDDDLTVTSLDINHTGLYPATLKVTNADGRSTYLSFNIGVQGDAKDETKTKIAVNKDDYTAKSIDVYSIDGEKVTPIKDKTLPINSQVVVYNDAQTVKGVRYVRLVNAGTERDKTNEWVRADQLSDTPETPEDQGVVKELMHAAYLYDAQGKRVGKTVLRSYGYIPVVYKRVKIGDKLFYRIAHSQNYIKCGNVDATVRKINAKAYIYNNKGKIVTVKKSAIVKRHGKVVKGTRRVRLYYSEKAKKNLIKTYGGQFIIKSKVKGKTVERRYYRIAKGRYVLASTLTKVEMKAATEQAAKEDADKTNATVTPAQSTVAANVNPETPEA